MIYITGDTHGTEDWEKINTRNFPDQHMLTRHDYLIILRYLKAWEIKPTYSRSINGTHSVH